MWANSALGGKWGMATKGEFTQTEQKNDVMQHIFCFVSPYVHQQEA